MCKYETVNPNFYALSATVEYLMNHKKYQKKKKFNIFECLYISNHTSLQNNKVKCK